MTGQLHYRGDQRNFDPDHIIGPDMYGAYYRAVAAEYDPGVDQTTLHLQVVPPAELQQRMVDALPTIQELSLAAAQVTALFAAA